MRTHATDLKPPSFGAGSEKVLHDWFYALDSLVVAVFGHFWCVCRAKIMGSFGCAGHAHDLLGAAHYGTHSGISGQLDRTRYILVAVLAGWAHLGSLTGDSWNGLLMGMLRLAFFRDGTQVGLQAYVPV